MRYVNCRIIDGTGKPAIENAVLITEDSKIIYAGPAALAPGNKLSAAGYGRKNPASRNL